jgi:hypothetical protein
MGSRRWGLFVQSRRVPAGSQRRPDHSPGAVTRIAAVPERKPWRLKLVMARGLVVVGPEPVAVSSQAPHPPTHIPMRCFQASVLQNPPAASARFDTLQPSPQVLADHWGPLLSTSPLLQPPAANDGPLPNRL